MPKKNLTKEELLELLSKQGGQIEFKGTGKVKQITEPSLDFTKLRFLANWQSSIVYISDLNLTIRPGQVVDLQTLGYTREQLQNSRSLRIALFSSNPLLKGYTEDMANSLVKDIESYTPTPSILEELKERTSGSGKVEMDMDQVLDLSQNPFQEDLEKSAEADPKNAGQPIVIGEQPRKPKKRGRKKKKSE